MKTIRITLFLALGCLQLSGASIGKGYEALKIFDYFKAKTIFQSTLKKHPYAAALGLSIIFERHDNPFFSIDSAGKYINKANNAFVKLNIKEKSNYQSITGFDDAQFISFSKQVYSKSFSQFLALIRNQDANQLENQITLMCQSPFYSQMLNCRDSIYLSQCEKQNSSTFTHNVIQNYPESFFLPQLIYLHDKQNYIEKTVNKDVISYYTFIKSHPNSSFITTAQNEIFELERNQRNVSGLSAFVKAFPSNKHYSEAWRLIYSFSVTEYSREALDDFILQFPDFPFRENIIDELRLLKTTFYPIRINNKCGFIDSTGLTQINASYETAEPFSEGLSLCSNSNGFGFISKKGEIVIPFMFEEAEDFKNGSAIVQLANQKMLINRTGEVISKKYDDIADFSEKLAIVKSGGFFGAIDQKGLEVIKPEFEKLGDFSEGLATAQQAGKYGYINKSGNFIIPPSFSWADQFINGVARVKINNKMGVIDKQGNIIVNCEFDLIEKSHLNVFLVVINNKYGFYHKSGCQLTKVIYQYSQALKPQDLIGQKWMLAIKGGTQNLIDANGNGFETDQEFEEIFIPSHELIRAKRKGKYGVLDMKRNEKIKFVHDKLSEIYDDRFISVQKEKTILMNLSGMPVFSEDNEQISFLINGLYTVSRGGKVGMIDKKGTWLLQPIYNSITQDSNGLLSLEQEGVISLFNPSTLSIFWTDKTNKE